MASLFLSWAWNFIYKITEPTKKLDDSIKYLFPIDFYIFHIYVTNAFSHFIVLVLIFYGLVPSRGFYQMMQRSINLH